MGDVVSAVAGPVIGGILGKKSSGSQTSTATTAPWGPAQPYLQGALGDAEDLYKNYRQMYYPGTMTAPLNPYQISGLNYQQGYAGSVQPYINRAQQMSSFMQSPAMLNVGQNPYVQGMGAAIGNQISQQLRRNIMPAIRSGNVAAGMLGGSRQGIAEGTAIGDAMQNYGNSLASLYGGAYQSGLGAVNQAQGLAPNMVNMGAYPAQLMRDVGQTYRGYDQQQINDAVNRFNWYQGQPDTRFDTYLGRISNIGGMGGSSTSTQPGMSSAQGILGGALAGYGLGKDIMSSFPSLSSGGGWGYNSGAFQSPGGFFYGV